MRIVIDGRLILPAMTGVGRYLLNLIPALAQVAQGEQIEVWLQKDLPPDHPAWAIGSPRMPYKAEVALRVLPYRHMSLTGLVRSSLDLRQDRADLFHYPHFDLPLLTRGLIVSTLHDLKYLARPGFFINYSRVKRLLFRLFARHTIRISRYVIAVSKNTAADAQSLLAADPMKLRIIPLGVDTRFFQPGALGEEEALRRRYHLDRPYILFVGERRPHKNLTGLIQAFAHFQHRTTTPFDLVIAGKRYSDYLAPEKIVEHLQLSDRVRFLDTVPDGDLPALYRAASATALLSLYEGFGLPVLEAMACGTPVVASNLTSLPEVAGNAAQLVPPDDPIQAAEALFQVVCNKDFREILIQRGRERAHTFTWERCARDTYAVYREAMEINA